MSSKFTPSEGTLCLHAAANIRRSLSSSIRFEYFTGLEHCNLLLIMEKKYSWSSLCKIIIHSNYSFNVITKNICNIIALIIVAVINAACVNLLLNKI